ncbi:MAG: hypothetical protein C0458_03700 [Methylobacterium sp.]|nr:hypothetical protein [Methylobacterium sp.]
MKIKPIPERHRWFDPWLIPVGVRLHGLAATYAALVERRELATNKRLRKRRGQAEADRETALGVIIANLAYETLSPSPSGRLAVLTGNNGRRIPRYSGPAKGKVLRDLLFELAELDVLDWQGPRAQRGEASSIRPTGSLRSELTSRGVTQLDIGQDEREEVILLTSRQMSGGSAAPVSRVLVDYPDTPPTMEMRDRLRGLNSFLAAADITFEHDGEEPVDPANRRMRRHFVTPDSSTRFDLSGRLYGGFWQNLARKRRGAIRIEGEAPVVLDYASMFTRLAYARAGLQPPEGDLYAIPGLVVPRDAVKVLVNAMFFDQHTRTAWPKDAETPQPDRVTVPELRRAVLALHPAIKDSFGRGVGLSLMHTESEVMAAVLDELRSRRIVALGLHDGLLVRSSQAEEAKKVMEQAVADICSISIPVHQKAVGE